MILKNKQTFFLRKAIYKNIDFHYGFYLAHIFFLKMVFSSLGNLTTLLRKTFKRRVGLQHILTLFYLLHELLSRIFSVSSPV